MAGATDQKTNWNLGETIAWIQTRDHDRVARMWEMSEFGAVAAALFDSGEVRRRVLGPVAFDAEGRLRIATGSPDPAGGGQAPEASGYPARVVDAGEHAEQGPQARNRPEAFGPDALTKPDQVLQDIMRRVQMGKVRMTMVRTGGGERIAVSVGEAQELTLRITEDAVVPVIAWSRTQGAMAGSSPWFSRADAVRAWPELSKKTAAARSKILRHLQEISTPECPLAKPEALERCLAEVPDAYPEAFKRAWAQLDPSRKLGRGRHGPRAH